MADEAATTEDLDVSEIADTNTFTVDEDNNVPGFDETEDDNGTEEVSTDGEKAGGEKGAVDDEFKKRFTDLEDNYKRASGHIEDLNKAISFLRKENKELKKGPIEDKDAVFTDAQLLAIMEENKDDQGVMLQAMKQLIKQGNADVQKVTDKKVELASKKSDIDSVMGIFQGYVEQERDNIDKAIAFHDLSDLPEWQRDHLALGSVIVSAWPDILKKLKDDAQKEVLEGRTETARKQSIKNNQPDTGGLTAKPGEGDIPASWAEAADRLGLVGKQRPKYFELMKKSSKKKER